MSAGRLYRCADRVIVKHANKRVSVVMSKQVHDREWRESTRAALEEMGWPEVRVEVVALAQYLDVDYRTASYRLNVLGIEEAKKLFRGGKR